MKLTYRYSTGRAVWRILPVRPWYGRVLACLWPQHQVRWQWGIVLFGLLISLEVVEHARLWQVGFTHAWIGPLPCDERRR